MSFEIDEGTGTVHTGTRQTQQIVDIYETGLPNGYESTAQRSAPTSKLLERSPGNATAHKPKLNPSIRDAMRRALDDAEKYSQEMIQSATRGDLVELAGWGFRLQDALTDLWKWRNERAEDWGDLLNLLQTALAQEELERFSIAQCDAIHRVIGQYLALESVDEDDLSAAISALKKVDLDPWKAVSKRPADAASDDES
jgi:hypothetical protein